MTTNDKKNKKFQLCPCISKDCFLKHINFQNACQKTICEEYLLKKGICYHVYLANFIGFDKEKKIDYQKISSLYILW